VKKRSGKGVPIQSHTKRKGDWNLWLKASKTAKVDARGGKKCRAWAGAAGGLSSSLHQEEKRRG